MGEVFVDGDNSKPPSGVTLWGKSCTFSTVGLVQKEHVLKQQETFTVHDEDVKIHFLNDKGNTNDVYFKFADGTTGDVTYPKNWDKWNCGEKNEHEDCRDVRDLGRF